LVGSCADTLDIVNTQVMTAANNRLIKGSSHSFPQQNKRHRFLVSIWVFRLPPRLAGQELLQDFAAQFVVTHGPHGRQLGRFV
jgi:hypothetical protein